MVRETGFSPWSNDTKDSKIVLDTAFVNTQHYKARFKGEAEQSREWSGVVAIGKGAFGSPSTKVTNFMFISLVSEFQ